MKNHFLLPCLSALLLCAAAARADDLTVGNLTVTGTADIYGTTLMLGTAGSGNPGISIQYNDDSSGTTSNVAITSTRNALTWKWQQNGSGGQKDKMILDNNNVLTIYAPNYTSGSTGKVIITPSTGGSTLTIDGNTVLTNAGADSVFLTPSTANSTYLKQDTANHATTIGSAAASGDYSTATGGSWAANLDATAMGESEADGVGSTATGGSIAIGHFSTAMGASEADGFGSTAMGGGIALGDYSMAIGNNAKALGYNQFVIGRYNILQGTASSWVSTDYLFIIGNGTDGSHPSNAFAVKKNGNTSVSGTLTTSGNTTVNGTLTANSDTTVTGNLTASGNVGIGTTTPSTKLQVNGNARIDGSLRIPPQGDLSMGAFTSE